MSITLEWWQWVFPAAVACFVVGVYKGWRVMGLWTVGVFFSGLVAARLGPKLELFINKFFSVAGQFFAIAADKDESSISTPQINIASPWEPVATGALFISLVVLSWWIARKLASGAEIGLVGHLIGGVFGALASIIGLSQSFDYWVDFVQRSGNPSAGVGASVTVPQISIGMASLPESNPLVGLATLSIGLFLLLVIVYTIWRALRAT